MTKPISLYVRWRSIKLWEKGTIFKLWPLSRYWPACFQNMLRTFKYIEHTYDNCIGLTPFRLHICLYLVRLFYPLWNCWKTTSCVTIFLEQFLLHNILLVKLSLKTIKTSNIAKFIKLWVKLGLLGQILGHLSYPSIPYISDIYSTILSYVSYHLSKLSSRFWWFIGPIHQ